MNNLNINAKDVWQYMASSMKVMQIPPSSLAQYIKTIRKRNAALTAAGALLVLFAYIKRKEIHDTFSKIYRSLHGVNIAVSSGTKMMSEWSEVASILARDLKIYLTTPAPPPSVALRSLDHKTATTTTTASGGRGSLKSRRASTMSLDLEEIQQRSADIPNSLRKLAILFKDSEVQHGLENMLSSIVRGVMTGMNKITPTTAEGSSNNSSTTLTSWPRSNARRSKSTPLFSSSCSSSDVVPSTAKPDLVDRILDKVLSDDGAKLLVPLVTAMVQHGLPIFLKHTQQQQQQQNDDRSTTTTTTTSNASTGGRTFLETLFLVVAQKPENKEFILNALREVCRIGVATFVQASNDAYYQKSGDGAPPPTEFGLENIINQASKHPDVTKSLVQTAVATMVREQYRLQPPADANEYSLKNMVHQAATHPDLTMQLVSTAMRSYVREQASILRGEPDTTIASSIPTATATTTTTDDDHDDVLPQSSTTATTSQPLRHHDNSDIGSHDSESSSDNKLTTVQFAKDCFTVAVAGGQHAVLSLSSSSSSSTTAARACFVVMLSIVLYYLFYAVWLLVCSPFTRAAGGSGSGSGPSF